MMSIMCHEKENVKHKTNANVEMILLIVLVFLMVLMSYLI